MRKIIFLGIALATIITVWSHAYAQRQFTLVTWSVSVTEPAAGVMQDGSYTITSGFLATQPTASPNYQIYLPLVPR